MSDTRKKLRRLFQEPSTIHTDAFSPRDLTRPVREFDRDGLPLTSETPALVQTSNQSLDTKADSPRNLAARSDNHRSDRGPITSEVAANKASKYVEIANDPTVRPPDKAAQQSAPWAAAGAFDSWSKSRANMRETAASNVKNPRTSDGETDDFPARASAQPKVHHPPEQKPNAPSRPHRIPHTITQKGSANVSGTGPKASLEFAIWRAQREREADGVEQAISSTESRRHTKVGDADGASPASGDAAFESAPVPAIQTVAEREMPSPTTTDRVRRRAQLAQRVENVRQGDSANRSKRWEAVRSEVPQAASCTDQKESARPSIVGNTRTPTEQREYGPPSESPVATRETSARRDVPSGPPDRSPTETLMWVIGQRDELSSDERIEVLLSLDTAPLRAAHQSRRLRLLVEAWLEQGNDAEALQSLHALQAILPHDSWTLLTLAETYAKNALTWLDALHWCEQTLRWHPWLSKAATLRDRLEALLQQVH